MVKKISKVRAIKIAKKLVDQEIFDMGGCTKEVLMSLGVSWPPRKGWKRKLIMAKVRGDDKPAPTTSNKDFYASWEWAELRFEAFRIHGRQCMCCGFVPNKGSRNYLCVDHIKPRSKYPELELDIQNLQILCNQCNRSKSNAHKTDFRQAWHDETWGENQRDSLTEAFFATMQ